MNELSAAAFYVNKYYYELKEASLKAAHKRIEYLLKEYAYHLDDNDKLIGLGSKIISTPLTAYLGSLEAVIEELTEFVDERQSSKESFIAKLLNTQRNGRYTQRTRP